ncbi:hypothetical protein CRP01_23565 [Flavilitoribacter nigricans DSM 23189 = NBRC 102662]|uniref:Uncharacterized protein n=1 Tax=Flavilitoribacter nigricans (strain ATCC 23147 / DSM 23189 / NBRC 102662 / NCIMB 1420 / SS-2) TaxID=1122177 RepID=A0A2D0N6R0_FLAN2|nr:hypothetical protein CRP01_23565 [Flavilitoribacter nigricans DSM 23189 = NBRC 102662]
MLYQFEGAGYFKVTNAALTDSVPPLCIHFYFRAAKIPIWWDLKEKSPIRLRMGLGSVGFLSFWVGMAGGNDGPTENHCRSNGEQSRMVGNNMEAGLLR